MALETPIRFVLVVVVVVVMKRPSTYSELSVTRGFHWQMTHIKSAKNGVHLHTYTLNN